MADWQDRWILLEESKVQEGGQGRVRKVKASSSGVIGALKEFHVTASSERHYRALRELDALTRVSGPGVPRTLDSSVSLKPGIGSSNWYVMEWIDGLRLSEFVSKEAPDIGVSLEIVKALLSIIERCHSVGVLHRDIKPDNVLIAGPERTVTLLDFGTSWLPDDPLDFSTEIGQELGNRFLRLPDMAGGRERQDHRTDLTFVVGILYFLVFRRAPKVLADEHLRAPHFANLGVLSEFTLRDPRWPKLKAIFDVGFQPDINYRFQSTGVLSDYLTAASEPDGPELEDPSSVELAALRSTMESAAFKNRQAIEESILDAAIQLELTLQRYANEQGLQSIHLAGGARVENRERAMFSFRLSRRTLLHPSAALIHVIQLSGPANNVVSAIYQIEGRGEENYYSGPASDKDSLLKAVMGNAGAIFAYALKELNYQLRYYE